MLDYETRLKEAHERYGHFDEDGKFVPSKRLKRQRYMTYAFALLMAIVTVICFI